MKLMTYTIRLAHKKDAGQLSRIRTQIDRETENLDREPGEGVLSTSDFRRIIEKSMEENNHLFLVAVVDNRIVGFSRCVGSRLRRLAHQVEFGVCVSKEHWGRGIGRALLEESLKWAEETGLVKVNLRVLETNQKAIALYQKYGFEIEGTLRMDKRHADGRYYDTILMGRILIPWPTTFD